MLIIHGTEDKLVPYSNVPFIEEQFSNASELKTLTMEDDNHFIVWEKEALLKSYILDWLAELHK